MARKARVLLPGVPLHIIQRGHNRQQCFFDHGDYLVYLDWLRKYCGQMGVSLHAYVLMTNHVHLLASFEFIGMAPDFMKAIGQKYTQYLNHRLVRTGTLWEGRYRSCPVPTERYLMTCQRYVELNPVRAFMVEQPGEYAWSSHLANAGAREDSLVQPHYLYMSLGSNPAARSEAYRRLFDKALHDADIAELRRATNSNTTPGIPPKANGRPRK
jgi:putative transposase